MHGAVPRSLKLVKGPGRKQRPGKTRWHTGRTCGPGTCRQTDMERDVWAAAGRAAQVVWRTGSSLLGLVGGGSPVRGWVGQPTALVLRQEWEGGREGRGGREASGLGHSNKGEEREGEERRWRQQRGERWGEGRMGTAPSCPV